MNAPPPSPSAGTDWARLWAILGAAIGAVVAAGKGALMLKGHLEEQRRKEVDRRVTEILAPLLDRALQPVRESQQQILLTATEDRQMQQDRHEENIGRFATLEANVKTLMERRSYPRDDT